MSIRARLGQLASESAIYGIAPLAQRLVSIFLTPLYTRVFIPADYGALSLIDSTVAVLAPLAVLALDSAAFRWFYDTTNEDEQRAAVATWFWTQLVFATVLACGVALFGGTAVRSLTGRPDAHTLLMVAVAALPLSAFETVVTNHARMHRRPWRALGTMLLSSGLSLTLTLVFVLKLRLGILGNYLSILLTRLVIGIVAVRLVGAWIAPRGFQLPLLRSMLRYSLPMVPTALFSWTIALVDRYFVAEYWSVDEVGLYSIGIAIGASLTLVTQAFQNAWSAFAFSIKDQPDARRTYAVVMELFLAGSCFLALGLSAFAPEALRLLATARYYAAANVVPWIAVGYVMAGLFQITGLGAMLARDTRPLLHAFALAAVANVALNFALIPPYGRVGAAIATLLSQAILPLYLLWRSQRLYPIPYRSWLTVAVPGATLAAGLMLQRVTAGRGLVEAVAIKTAALIVFATALVLVSPIRGTLVKRFRLATRGA